MPDPPLLTLISLALPTELQGVFYVTQFINQLLLPPTIDAAVYLDLQRVVKVFGATSTWTVDAMDGAAARGRLDIVKWLGRTRSEGCSSVAFNDAAANGHLDMLRWLCQFHSSKCNPKEALVCAAGAGHLEVVKRLRTEFPFSRGFRVNYDPVLEAAARNEHFEVLEHILANEFAVTQVALAAAAKNGQIEVTRMLVRGSQSLNNIELENSRALEYAAAGGHIGILALLIQFCYGYWGKQCIAPALREAAAAGHLAAVVMLEPRCKGSAIGEALGIAVAKGHEEIVEFLFRRCPAAEMVPAMVAAANRDLLGLLERILAKRERKIVGLDYSARTHLCSSFRSAASRGSEKIAMLLVATLLSTWEYPVQSAIFSVLEDAASHSKYDMVKCILDAMKARQLCILACFGDAVLRDSNDVEMVELLTKYREEGVIELRLELIYEQFNKFVSEQHKKKQRRR